MSPLKILIVFFQGKRGSMGFPATVELRFHIEKIAIHNPGSGVHLLPAATLGTPGKIFFVLDFRTYHVVHLIFTIPKSWAPQTKLPSDK